jgi:hypothetical protein
MSSLATGEEVQARLSVSAERGMTDATDSQSAPRFVTILPTAIRIASHATVWLAIFVPVIVVLHSGWVASGDDAAIAVRSHQVLSLHPPLVGLTTTAASGSGPLLHDPGPLLFWILAIPVRLDPVGGALWGAAFAAAAALSIAIEAVRSTGRWFGCLLVALSVVIYLCFIPVVTENILWNAYFPLPLLAASIAISWVVTTGRFGWWPVLVVIGSAAAQTQLIYLLPIAAIVLSAPLVALALGRRPQRIGWLAVGLGLAVVCWIAPLLQNWSANGNLSALLASGHGQPTMGLGFGLRVMGTVGSPSALWTHSPPNTLFAVLGLIRNHSEFFGAALLVLLVSISVIGLWFKQRGLAGLAAITFLVSVGTVIGFALIPPHNLLNLDYMITVLWLVSLAVWITVVWAVVALIHSQVHRLQFEEHRFRGASTYFAGLATCGVVALTVAGLVQVVSFVPSPENVGLSMAGFSTVREIASQIERAAPTGPLGFSISGDHDDVVRVDMAEAVAWRLTAAGRQVGTYVAQADTDLRPAPGAAEFVIKTRNERETSFAQIF